MDALTVLIHPLAHVVEAGGDFTDTQSEVFEWVFVGFLTNDGGDEVRAQTGCGSLQRTNGTFKGFADLLGQTGLAVLRLDRAVHLLDGLLQIVDANLVGFQFRVEGFVIPTHALFEQAADIHTGIHQLEDFLTGQFAFGPDLIHDDGQPVKALLIAAALPTRGCRQISNVLDVLLDRVPT